MRAQRCRRAGRHADYRPDPASSPGPRCRNAFPAAQRDYLNTYAQHAPTGGGDQQTEVGPGNLSENSEGEWA